MTQKQALEELRRRDCIWINCKDAAMVSGFSENSIRQGALKRWEEGKYYEPYRIDVEGNGVRVHLADLIAFCEDKKM